MKFKKGLIPKYLIQPAISCPANMDDIVSSVISFTRDIHERIKKDGHECDEYDILYCVSYDQRHLEMWFVVNDKKGLLILGFPQRMIMKYKPDDFKNAIEEALKENNEQMDHMLSDFGMKVHNAYAKCLRDPADITEYHGLVTD